MPNRANEGQRPRRTPKPLTSRGASWLGNASGRNLLGMADTESTAGALTAMLVVRTSLRELL